MESMNRKRANSASVSRNPSSMTDTLTSFLWTLRA